MADGKLGVVWPYCDLPLCLKLQYGRMLDASGFKEMIIECVFTRAGFFFHLEI